MTDTFYCFQANIVGLRNHWPAPEDVVAELQSCAPPTAPRKLGRLLTAERSSEAPDAFLASSGSHRRMRAVATQVQVAARSVLGWRIPPRSRLSPQHRAWGSKWIGK
jgi:hypothetical protein